MKKIHKFLTTYTGNQTFKFISSFDFNKNNKLCKQDANLLKFCYPQLMHRLSWNTVTNHEMLENLFEEKSFALK